MYTQPLVGRLAALVGFVALAASAPAGATTYALFADQSLKVAGSRNVFCGAVHANGTAKVTGNGHLVSGKLEYAGRLQTNGKSTLNATKADQAPMPLPAHDVSFYRDQAKASGTYFPGNADVSKVSGLVFAEGDIRQSGADIQATVTFVSANGSIFLDGDNNNLRPAVDGVLMFAATGDADATGAKSNYDGGIYMPAGSFSRTGTESANVTGPIVAKSISITGSGHHLGGECCAAASDCSPEACDAPTSTVDGVCEYGKIADCIPCTTAADCPLESCSTAVCNGGVCGQDRQATCTACTKASDCAASDACKAPTCTVDNLCSESTIPGCILCNTAADCPVTDCQTATCNAGTCAISTVADCKAPAPKEICGDCIDNDGDGLVDAEDPDCCEAPLAFGAKIVQLRPLSRKGDRLRLMGQFAPKKPAGFDPRTQDTSIQLTDDQGALFCATVDSSHWMPMGKNTISFWTKKNQSNFANGLTDGRFTVKRNGSVIFRTHGTKTKLRTPMARRVQITVRVGNQCSTTTTALRPTKSGLALKK